MEPIPIKTIFQDALSSIHHAHPETLEKLSIKTKTLEALQKNTVPHISYVPQPDTSIAVDIKTAFGWMQSLSLYHHPALEYAHNQKEYNMLLGFSIHEWAHVIHHLKSSPSSHRTPKKTEAVQGHIASTMKRLHVTKIASAVGFAGTHYYFETPLANSVSMGLLAGATALITRMSLRAAANYINQKPSRDEEFYCDEVMTRVSGLSTRNMFEQMDDMLAANGVPNIHLEKKYPAFLARLMDPAHPLLKDRIQHNERILQDMKASPKHLFYP